jgi:hypothetical protein
MGGFPPVTGFLNYENQCALMVINGGGRGYTTQWFEDRLPSEVVFYPAFNKPPGYYECQDYIYLINGNAEHDKLLKGWIPDSVKKFLSDDCT